MKNIGMQLGKRRARKFALQPIAQEYRQRGLSLREIAASLGVCVQTAQKWTAGIAKGDIFK